MDNEIISAFYLSIKVALISTSLVALSGVVIAYFLARKSFAGKNLIDSVLTLPMVLPPTVVGFYLVMILGKNGIIGAQIYRWTGFNIMFTWQAAVAASFVVSLPLMIKTVKVAIESVDDSLVKTSLSLGHSEIETFFRVILPLIGRGVITGLTLAFIRSLGEFGATLMLAGNIPGKTATMPTLIYSVMSSGEWERANFIVLFYTMFSVTVMLVTVKLSEGVKVYA